MNRPLVRVLLVDDDEDDYVLTKELLAEIPGDGFTLDWVSTFEAGLETLARCEHDLALIDYRLGPRNGIDLIREVHRQGCHCPMIMLTGQGERDVDFAAMRAGAADYLEKAH